MDTQSSSAVPITQSRTWSIDALAALAAEDDPRAAMMAVPRTCTVGMKSFSTQSRSSITASAGSPATVAWDRSGYCVAEWFPQTDTLRTDDARTPVFFTTCAIARLW